MPACTAERSFSLMKRLKTPLRNTMPDDRLSSLAILHIQKEKLGNQYCGECARQFAEHKERRLALCFIKRKTLLSACSRIRNQNNFNVLFATSSLKIRARRFVLCLYSLNYFEQEIKNAVFFASVYLRH